MLLLLLFGLIAMDQSIKLLIANYFINDITVLLPNILFFRPVQNTHLNWIASIFEYKAPALLMIMIQIFALIIIMILYRYLSYLWMKGKKLLNGMMLFFVSGIVCSFIDVVFWGGSLDFLRLFNWFTFDLKDVYLNIGIIFLLIYTANYYFKVYFKMSRAERKQTGFWIWIKKGMPLI
jgi:signal peptidase II